MAEAVIDLEGLQVLLEALQARGHTILDRPSVKAQSSTTRSLG